MDNTTGDFLPPPLSTLHLVKLQESGEARGLVFTCLDIYPNRVCRSQRLFSPLLESRCCAVRPETPDFLCACFTSDALHFLRDSDPPRAGEAQHGKALICARRGALPCACLRTDNVISGYHSASSIDAMLTMAL
jgi:hypothetical protein